MSIRFVALEINRDLISPLYFGVGTEQVIGLIYKLSVEECKGVD